ncbi:hypothetical protein CLU79DRAFT_762674 [Phycomyces nitens]|nr:hypothetical protein CLU79DRAFT_762674 [Phycomyces nitens]
MPFEIPFEILSNIAMFLSLEEKITCSYVCRLWREPFRLATWADTNIDTIKTYHSIVKSKPGEKTAYHKNGIYVKKLTINRFIRTKRAHLKAFQHEFPNLLHLSLGFVFLRKCNYGIRANWNDWGFLSTLIVEMDDFVANPPKGFFDIFSFLPLLKRLELVEVTPRVMKLDMQDLETLLINAPLLEYVHLCGILSNLTSKALETLPKTCTPNNVRVLKINCLYNDVRWIYYFTQRYSNARELLLKLKETTSLPKMSLDIVFPTFFSAPRSFSRLEDLSLHFTGDSDDSHLLFWKLFPLLELPVKRLIYRPYFCNVVEDGISKQTIYFCVAALPTTIEELYIAFFETGDFGQCLNMDLSRFACLVKLNITAFKVSVNIDKLLNDCKVLKVIMLSDLEIDISPDACEPFTPHNISTIWISRSSTTTDTLNYISSRCRKLQALCFSGGVIVGSISEKTGRLLIDMSFSHLKYFHLNYPKIHSRSTYRIKDITINVIAIHKPVNRQLNGLQVNNTIKSQTALLDGVQQKVAKEVIWFHVYRELGDAHNWKSTSRALGRKESKRATKYFQNFETRVKGNTDYYKKPNVYYYSQVPRRRWKKDLWNGYAEIRFGSIEEYDLKKEKCCEHDKDMLKWI